MALGYKPFNENRSFAQFQGLGGLIAVDLLIVSQATWVKLRAAREVRRHIGYDWPLAAPLHIVALKLHAITEKPARYIKDWPDIIELIRLCGIDVQSAAFREIVMRYGGSEIYARLSKRTYFPDGSSEVDYGDLILPSPPPDQPLRDWPANPEADAILDKAYLAEYSKRPGFHEWLKSPLSRGRFEL